MCVSLAVFSFPGTGTGEVGHWVSAGTGAGRNESLGNGEWIRRGWARSLSGEGRAQDQSR